MKEREKEKEIDDGKIFSSPILIEFGEIPSIWEDREKYLNLNRYIKNKTGKMKKKFKQGRSSEVDFVIHDNKAW